MSGNAAAIVVGAVVLGLLVWVVRVGDPSTMQFAGVTLGNPETQQPKVLLDNIGVHGIIGNGAHTHGAMNADQQKADLD